MEFLVPEDIANRALQYCGAELMDPIQGFSETTRNARQTSFMYGKLRQAELHRNTWRFAIREAALRPVDTNTFLLVPTLFSPITTYFLGCVVADGNRTLWPSTIPNNLGNDPLNTEAQFWEPYFGPLSVTPYDSSQNYFAGELVYTAAGDGTYNTYVSLFNSNAVHPALPNQWIATTVYNTNDVVQVFPAWSSLTTYAQGNTVLYTDGNVYSSLTNANLNHAPATSPTNWVFLPTLTLQSQPVPFTSVITPPQISPVLEWSQGTTYSLGSSVMFNGTQWLSIANNNTGNFPNAPASTFWKAITLGVLYMSLIDLNFGNPPASVPTAWTTTFTEGGGNSTWRQIGGAAFPNGVGLAPLRFAYPVKSGPLSQTATRNVYRLPAGYLKPAPQDPRAGGFSPLGAPGGNPYVDWKYEGNFIVTSEVRPIIFRFVADVTDVSTMTPLFCEGLAARIAVAVCETLTQSSAKVGVIQNQYQKFMTEARMVNGIETGPEEPPLDDYISCRA